MARQRPKAKRKKAVKSAKARSGGTHVLTTEELREQLAKKVMECEKTTDTGVSKRELMNEFARTENSLVIRFKTGDLKIPMFATEDSQTLLTTERKNLRYFREINNSCEFF